MKRIVLIIVLALIAHLNLTAQSKVDIYFDIAPAYSYRSYTLKDYSEEKTPFPSGEIVYDYFKQGYDSTESATIGFSSTLGIAFNINDKVKVITGLGYKNIGEEVSFYNMTARYIFDDIIIYSYSSEELTIRNTYQYIKIPVDFQYHIRKIKGVDVGLVGGLDLDIRIKSKIFYTQGKSSESLKHENAKTANIVLNAHLGLIAKYHWKDNLSIFIQPEFARSLTPNVRYDIRYGDIFAKINQYNYYGQIRFGVILSRP